MISVIMPTYNRLEYIEEAIESFLMQDAPEKELIVVNDGSDLDYTPVINKYADQDNVFFLMASHEGCSSAINYGIKESRGKYICLLADDDLLVGADSLSKRAHAIKNYNCEVVYTGFKKIYGNGEQMTIQRVSSIDKLRIWAEDYINIISMMWKRSVHDKIGYFSEDLINNEDWEWKIKCLEECDVFALDYTTVASRYHGKNKSIVNRKETWRCAEILMKRMKERYT